MKLRSGRVLRKSPKERKTKSPKIFPEVTEKKVMENKVMENEEKSNHGMRLRPRK